MDNKNEPVKKPYEIAYAIFVLMVVWFAIILQFIISLEAYQTAGRTIGGTVVQFFSFFTILCNLLVALSLTVPLMKPLSPMGAFFSKATVKTAITVYITIVGIIYALLLRQLWHPEGWFKIADELLHTACPLLYVFYWLAFVPKTGLKWTDCFPWLWFPFIYFVYILIRGAISQLYPYPFVDVARYGYGQVLLNSLIFLLVFWGTGLIFIGIGRIINRLSKSTAT